MTPRVIGHSWPTRHHSAVVWEVSSEESANQAWRRSRALVLSIAAFVALMAVLTSPVAPLFDPDEGYYPATAAETMRSGPFWDLRFNDAPRWEKPILSYALIESAFLLLGERVVAARVPSAVEGALLVTIVGLVVGRLAGRRAGLISAMVVGSTLGVGVFSRAAHPEIAVVASVVTTELMICVWLSTADRTTQRKAALGCGLSLGLGLLAKGPVAAALPMLTLCILAILDQLTPEHAKRMGWDGALCLAVAALIAMPWYALMTAHHGIAFLSEAVWQQNVGRFTTTAYGHASGALAVWLPALVGLFPWLALLPQSLSRIRVRQRTPRELLRTGMFVGALGALVFYSLSSSKLASYAFVAVPGLGITVSLWLDDLFDHPGQLRSAWLQCIGLHACLGVVLLTAPLWLGATIEPRRLFGGIRPPGTDTATMLSPLAVSLGFSLLAGAAVLVVSRSTWSRVLTVAVIGVIVPVVVLVSASSILHGMYPWDAIGAKVDTGYGPVLLMGRRAPSLTFYAHAPVRLVSDAEALGCEVRRQPRCWLVVTSEEWTQLEANLSEVVNGSIVESRGRMVLVQLRPHTDGR